MSHINNDWHLDLFVTDRQHELLVSAIYEYFSNDTHLSPSDAALLWGLLEQMGADYHD